MWVLWGAHPLYAGGVPIKLTGGTPAECRRERRFRERGGFTRLRILPANRP